MSSKLVEYQVRIRNSADTADALTLTSIRGGTNPDIAEAPTGEGATLDPFTGKITSGSITVNVVDRITAGTSRVFTSALEDANFRQQLGQRKTYVEFRENGGAWQTLYAGRIANYRTVTDAVWAITVSDWMKAEHEYQVFDMRSDETLEDYLDRWPNRGCIIGGPILGGFREVEDLGGWTFKVAGEGSYNGTDFTRLEFVRGYLKSGVPIETLDEGAGLDFVRSLNETMSAFAVKQRIVRAASGLLILPIGSWPDLAVIVDRDLANPRTAIRPLAGLHIQTLADLGGYPILSGWTNENGTSGYSLYLNGSLATLGFSVNQIVRIDIISRKVSPESPIYWTGHPVDLMSTLWDEASLPYVASSLETVRNTLGAHLRLTLEITQAENLGGFLERAVYGWAGIGARGAEALADAGKLEAFVTRIFNNTPPAIEITDADVVQDTTEAFDLDSSAAVQRVVIEHEHFTPVAFTQGFTGAFERRVERFERDNGDPDAIGTGVITFRIPGMVHIVDNNDGFDMQGWVDGRAHEVFDRRGRGELRLKTTLIRGGAGDAVKLGDEILVNLKQLPNKNKRLGDDPTVGARAMQVLHVTPTLIGKVVELEDSGPNAQPIDDADRPTHTIAASATKPRTVAMVTITNAATLTAAGRSVRIQMAVTTGAAPAATDYAEVMFFAPAEIPTVAFPLPPVSAGRLVAVRMRAEAPGDRPSNWTTPTSVTLTGMSAPSALAVTAVAGNGSALDAAWTNGASDLWTEVFVRLSGAPLIDAVKRVTLAPGSDRVRIDGLAGNTAYTIGVRHVDGDTGDRSATVEDTETTANASLTLSAPIHAHGWSSPLNTQVLPGSRFRPRRASALGGRYGIAVMATEFPSHVEVEEALETAEGAGTYGSFAVVGRVESIASEWTVWMGIAANDGLRRQLRARHVREGYTSSAYATTVTVSPWTLQSLPQHAGPQGTVSIGTDGAAKFSVDGGFNVGSYKYDDSTSSYPADATVASSGATLDGRVHNDVSTGTNLALGQRIYITIVPFSGPNGTGVQGPSIHLTATRHDTTATKTVFQAVASLKPTNPDNDGLVLFVNGYITNQNWGVTSRGVDFRHQFIIPGGTTITAIGGEVFRMATNDTGNVSFALIRVDADGTETIIAVTGAQTSGWESLSALCSESTTSRRYVIRLRMESFPPILGENWPGDGDLRASAFSYTYTMPSTVNAI